MMPDIWRETFLIHSRTPEYAQKVRQASVLIGDFLDRHERAYLAYSGGKDSAVMIHLVTRIAPGIDVLHSDEGSDPRVLSEIVAVGEGCGAHTVQIERPLNVHAVARRGYDGVFVGLRKEESLKRKRRMLGGGTFGAIDECWPLADWTWRDIWGYLVANGLPYLSHYDTVAPVVGWDNARYHHLFDAKIAHTGNMTIDGVLHWRMRGPR